LTVYFFILLNGFFITGKRAEISPKEFNTNEHE
jgi:hypothetical protein